MNQLEKLRLAIQSDPENQAYTAKGIPPLYMVYPEAEILIVGQAPGQKAEAAQEVWRDTSGVRLRTWLGLSEAEFYYSRKIAVLPCDFYYPGKGKQGDLPPRQGFASRWHPLFLQEMPHLKLIILVGTYAIHQYLSVPKSVSLATIVQHYAQYFPPYFPLVHPSPRNQNWLKQHPWFEAKVLPELRQKIRTILEEN